MYTYIVVDDETLIRKGTIKKLEAIKDTVICVGEAENGQDALELIAERNPDIIITDMNMPVMDGVQFLPCLTEKYPDKRIIVISGYKDFDYMKQAITAQAVDYILKPFSREALQASVLNAAEQLKNSSALKNQLITSEEQKEQASFDYDIQMLKNLVMGYHTSDAVITSKRLNTISSSHSLLLITIHSNICLQDYLLQNFLEENSFGDLALFLQHMQTQHLGFLILFIPERSVLSKKELCRQIIDGLEHFFFGEKQEVLFGISRPHRSLLELHEAFMETVSALNSREIGNKDTNCFSEVSSVESKTIIWNKTEEFLFRIEAGMEKEVKDLLEELFRWFKEIPHCTLYDVKMFCFRLNDRVRFIASTYFEQIDPDSANSSMQNILNSMFRLSEIKEYYLQFYLNLTRMLKKDSIYAIDDTIEKIKIYVDRHYQNDLTIEFLSSLFYMNRSYLSHLFREKSGETFVNYVNRVRLDHAKQLLRDTDKKMYQIAKNVGYDNVKYFFRIFKKYEDMTPEQYRNLNP